MKEISQTPIPLSPPDGLTVRKGRRCATRQSGSHSAMGRIIALENRKTWPKDDLTFRLAIMELIPMVLASLTWTFDMEMAEDGQAEPHFMAAFIIMRGPCPVQLSRRFKN
jgi:hypothetical protein